MTAELFSPRRVKLYTWRFSLKAGRSIVKLHLPHQVRRTGVYTMRWTARSGRESTSRKITIRLVGTRNVPAAPVQVAAGRACRPKHQRQVPGADAEARHRLGDRADVRRCGQPADRRARDRGRCRRIRRLTHPRPARGVPVDEDRRSHLGPEADDRLAEGGRIRRPASVDPGLGPHPPGHETPGEAGQAQARQAVRSQTPRRPAHAPITNRLFVFSRLVSRAVRRGRHLRSPSGRR